MPAQSGQPPWRWPCCSPCGVRHASTKERSHLTEADIPFSSTIPHPILARVQGPRWMPNANAMRTLRPRRLHRIDSIPWLPIPPEHITASVKRQHADPSSGLQQTRALVKMHTETAAFHTDKLDIIDCPRRACRGGRRPCGALRVQHLRVQDHGETPEWRAAHVVGAARSASTE